MPPALDNGDGVKALSAGFYWVVSADGRDAEKPVIAEWDPEIKSSGGDGSWWLHGIEGSFLPAVFRPVSSKLEVPTAGDALKEELTIDDLYSDLARAERDYQAALVAAKPLRDARDAAQDAIDNWLAERRNWARAALRPD